MNTILLFGLVSFINDAASKMILPILPLYIAQIGGAGLAVGLISGFGESISSFLKVLSGYWSDKLGRRKPFIVSGYALSACSKLALAWAGTWPTILLLRSLERVGKGVRSAARDSLLSAAAQGRSGHSFGIHRAFDSGGAILGTLVVLLLVSVYQMSFPRVFLVAGIVSFGALIPLFFIRETHTPPMKKMPKLSVSVRNFSNELKLFLAAGSIFSLGNFSWMFFVLRAQSANGNTSSFTFPIVLYAVYHLVSTLGAIPSGILADRIGKAKVLLMGYALFALIAIGFILFSSYIALLILFALYGVMFALVESNERAYVADLADEQMRGTALGTFFTFTSLAALPAGAITGLLYDKDPSWAFAYGAILATLAVLLLFVQLVLHTRHVGSKANV